MTPDQTNIAVIRHLEAKVRLLEEQVEIWKKKAQDNWDVLETVATGEGIICENCKKSRPCTCHDLG